MWTNLMTEKSRDCAETIAGVCEGEQAAAEGRERPLSVFLAEQCKEHGLSPDWPHKRANKIGDTQRAGR